MERGIVKELLVQCGCIHFSILDQDRAISVQPLRRTTGTLVEEDGVVPPTEEFSLHCLCSNNQDDRYKYNSGR